MLAIILSTIFFIWGVVATGCYLDQKQVLRDSIMENIELKKAQNHFEQTELSKHIQSQLKTLKFNLDKSVKNNNPQHLKGEQILMETI